MPKATLLREAPSSLQIFISKHTILFYLTLAMTFSCETLLLATLKSFTAVQAAAGWGKFRGTPPVRWTSKMLRAFLCDFRGGYMSNNTKIVWSKEVLGYAFFVVFFLDSWSDQNDITQNQKQVIVIFLSVFCYHFNICSCRYCYNNKTKISKIFYYLYYN